MTNLYETAMAAAKKALGSFLSASDYQPGEAHLTGAVAGARSSSLDEDLDALLHEIQRRRGVA